MSLNSSSSLNGGHFPSSFSVNMFSAIQICFSTSIGTINLSAFVVTSVLVVLPVCGFILRVGVQRWLQSSSAALSHSDHFTYHMILSELLSLTGFVFTFCGARTNLPRMELSGIYLFCVNLIVHMFFDTLTCVERYLAVVHPVTYRNLKNAKGVRIRNVSTGCTWLLSVSMMGLLNLQGEIPTVIIVSCITSFSLTVVFFCSLSVLCVLVRPGPGERRQRADPSKLRAFYTILVILTVLLFRLGGCTLISALYTSSKLKENTKCHLILFLFWTCLPTSVLPLVLFLQRAGKVLCC